jgi:hypothetical protein
LARQKPNEKAGDGDVAGFSVQRPRRQRGQSGSSAVSNITATLEVNTTPAPADRAVDLITAAQVEKSCPAKLLSLGERVTVHFKKAREYEEKAERHQEKARQHYPTIGWHLAEAKKICDTGGFNAFREKFCPSLGKSRAYELLAIATDKKSDAEIKAATRERVARHRAKSEESTNPVSVTATDGNGVDPDESAEARMAENAGADFDRAGHDHAEHEPEDDEPDGDFLRREENYGRALKELTDTFERVFNSVEDDDDRNCLCTEFDQWQRDNFWRVVRRQAPPARVVRRSESA